MVWLAQNDVNWSTQYQQGVSLTTNNIHLQWIIIEKLLVRNSGRKELRDMSLKGLRFRIVTVIILTGFSLSACTLISEKVLSTETARVTTTVIQELQPTATDVEQMTTMELSTAEPTIQPGVATAVIFQKTLKEEGEDPKYTVEVNYPFIDGMEGFNQASWAIAERITAAFMENLATYPVTTDPNLMSYSSVSMDYTVLDNTPEVISVYFQISEYYSGAAHPLPFSSVLNYDVRNQKVLALSDLFQPDKDYLNLISAFVINELSGEEKFTFLEGALPEAKNYQNWNLTPDGLHITFDPYQVAPYAAGFISVDVPTDVLIGFANPDGVLVEN